MRIAFIFPTPQDRDLSIIEFKQSQAGWSYSQMHRAAHCGDVSFHFIAEQDRDSYAGTEFGVAIRIDRRFHQIGPLWRVLVRQPPT